MAPVVRALAHAPNIEAKVCVTAQHREMLDQVLVLFGIAPDFDLDLMKSGQGLTELTTGILIGMRETLNTWRPDLVLVHGDTTTALAASLAAFYEKVSVGHVEAGLRTNDIYAPWPEEMNRRVVSSIAEVHFAPTATAKANLINEGKSEQQVLVTGNTVIDSLLLVVKQLETDKVLAEQMMKKFSFLEAI